MPDESIQYPNDNSYAAEKVKTFPHVPGVYLMKDAHQRVIYVGKAKDLHKRAGSYFRQAAEEDPRTKFLVKEIRDIDYIQALSEVDALLMEARLIKDIQPHFNRELKDGKSFPYLQIRTHEQFPRVEATREPLSSGVKLYGPFVSPVRGALVVLQKVFKFRTCQYDIREDDPKRRFFRPCLLASIGQCTAPCCGRISREDYRRSIHRLQRFLEGKRAELIEEMKDEMRTASKELNFEQAAVIRDQLAALENLDKCGDLERNVQPEVFQMDPKRGLAGLQKILRLPKIPRVIEGVDIAHLHGEATVASLVQFIDGLPFKAGYKRYRIKSVKGINDFASIGEVVYRRLKRLKEEGGTFPDIFLIDGGKGQLHYAEEAAEKLNVQVQFLSLAEKNEEIFLPGESEPLRLSRHAWSLRLLQYVRDEAHRFAQHYHHLLRSRKLEE